MSYHEGVSCDVCTQHNFTGLRYKCLRCYDFDLCSQCYNRGATASDHTADHPMQCLLTKNDANIIYGGSSTMTSEAYSCPYCGQLGFNAGDLLDHVQGDHSDSLLPDVICSVCVCHHDIHSNQRIDNLEDHLIVAHPVLTTESPSSSSSSAPAINNNNNNAPNSSTTSVLNNAASDRLRYYRQHNPNTQFSGTRISSNSQSVAARSGTNQSSSDIARNLTRGSLLHLIDPAIALAPGGFRESYVIDPIAELLSHLSSVRGRLAGTTQGVASHLQQLEVQLSSAASKTHSSLTSVDRQYQHIRNLYSELELVANPATTTTTNKKIEAPITTASSSVTAASALPSAKKDSNKYLLNSFTSSKPPDPTSSSSSSSTVAMTTSAAALTSSSSSPSLSNVVLTKQRRHHRHQQPQPLSATPPPKVVAVNRVCREQFVQELLLFCTTSSKNKTRKKGVASGVVDDDYSDDDDDDDDRRSSSSPSFTQLPLSLSSSPPQSPPLSPWSATFSADPKKKI